MMGALDLMHSLDNNGRLDLFQESQIKIDTYGT